MSDSIAANYRISVTSGIIVSGIGDCPDGFLDCDGSIYSATEYPDLFKVVGEAYTPVFWTKDVEIGFWIFKIKRTVTFYNPYYAKGLFAVPNLNVSGGE